jgi:Nucleotidyltransferase
MSPTGDVDLAVAARTALLDALDALHMHRASLIVIGAQAVYLQAGAAQVALAEVTKDSDLTLDTRTLTGTPRLEEAMEAAGFRLDPRVRQPGAWLSRQGIPVDLMVAESQAGSSGRRERASRRIQGIRYVAPLGWRRPSSTIRCWRSGRLPLTTTAGVRRTSPGPPLCLLRSCSSCTNGEPRPGAWWTKMRMTFTACWSRCPPASSLPHLAGSGKTHLLELPPNGR